MYTGKLGISLKNQFQLSIHADYLSTFHPPIIVQISLLTNILPYLCVNKLLNFQSIITLCVLVYTLW